jgi:hypothetical protein
MFMRPFCHPGKKKLDYSVYCSHVVDVGVSRPKAAKVKAEHGALSKHLKLTSQIQWLES